jgi:hypothetical protein
MSGDTPDNTGKTLDQEPQRLNEKLRVVLEEYPGGLALVTMTPNGPGRESLIITKSLSVNNLYTY